MWVYCALCSNTSNITNGGNSLHQIPVISTYIYLKYAYKKGFPHNLCSIQTTRVGLHFALSRLAQESQDPETYDLTVSMIWATENISVHYINGLWGPFWGQRTDFPGGGQRILPPTEIWNSGRFWLLGINIFIVFLSLLKTTAYICMLIIAS